MSGYTPIDLIDGEEIRTILRNKEKPKKSLQISHQQQPMTPIGDYMSYGDLDNGHIGIPIDEVQYNDPYYNYSHNSHNSQNSHNVQSLQQYTPNLPGFDNEDYEEEEMPNIEEIISRVIKKTLEPKDITCSDVFIHIQKCPVCQKFYMSNNSLYIIIIVILAVVCILLMKKLGNI